MSWLQAQRHGGAFRSRAPHMTACAPPNESCAPPSEDCAPKKSTDSVLLECKPKPKTPKLVFTALEFVSKNCIFVIFVNLHRISFKFWDEDLFYGLHFRIHGKMQEFWVDNQNLWKFWDEDLFFFILVFTSELVENRKDFETTTTICGNFETKTVFLTSRAPVPPSNLHK